jgi:solute carrier family 34 (sodium-dependent phosphate cotransporter)
MSQGQNTTYKVIQLLGWLYLFLISIAMIGSSFKLLGGGFAETMLGATSNPIIGLLTGLLATSLCQSSSTTTSLVVGLVASGSVTIEGAIPLIMGANIGTTITATLVSMAHLTRSEEFRRAFAAATVHDFFNLLSVAVFLPIEISFGIIQKSALVLSGWFETAGGLKFGSPLKVITEPVVNMLKTVVAENGWILLVLGILFLFLSLRYLVLVLKVLLLHKASALFDRYFFKSSIRSMLLGICVTVMVQSSSITTSLAIPLAGAGALKLKRIYPFTMGANIGTTVTALLAALSTANISAVAIAFAHLIFNILGIAVWWPLQVVPLSMARGLASLALKNRMYPLIFIGIVFFGIPFAILFLL